MKKIPTLFIFVLLCLPFFALTDVTATETTTTTTNSTTTTSDSSESEPLPIKNTQHQGGLLLPQVRGETNFSTESNQICSGISRGKPYFMTSQVVYNEFKWVIMKPVDESKCLFRISQDVDQYNDTAYVPLLPLDSNHNVISDDGWFDCGSQAGVGKGTFKIPDEIDCDQCILEWVWKSPKSQVRQCADITVMRTQNSECVAMCQNGGICHSGGCYCPQGYTGEYCEIKKGFLSMFKGASWILFYTILAIIFIIGAAAVILYFKNKKEVKEQALLASGRKSARKDLEDKNQGQDQSVPKKSVQLAIKV